MKTIAIYPGTFDPITHGHVDIIQRAARLFDTLWVAVAGSDRKQPWLPLAKRLELTEQLVAGMGNVKVCQLPGLTIDLAREKQAQAIIRGVRNSQDLDYELQLANMNRQMAPEIDTIFLVPDEKHRLVSASIVREIAEMGGDLSLFVDPRVAKALAWR